LGVARKKESRLTGTPGVIAFEQMNERDENLGTAGKHGKVGANLAMLLASQDLKPTAGRMGEAQSTVNSEMNALLEKSLASKITKESFVTWSKVISVDV
jgi:hypothetical protein